MKPMFRGAFLMVLMFGAASLAWALTPTRHLADRIQVMQLETMVPKSFGDWRELPSASAAVVDTGRQKEIDRIYSAVLSRAYVNDQNYLVMLSIAYGRDQSDGLELHQPEVCYPAQGFTVANSRPSRLWLENRSVPATQLDTSQGSRVEPVTYWTVVGEQNYRGGLAKKFAQMSYGFHGDVPDGMLVRISSIDPESSNARRVHAEFAADFAAALPPSMLRRFLGVAGP